jgi:hypothetical protein
MGDGGRGGSSVRVPVVGFSEPHISRPLSALRAPIYSRMVIHDFATVETFLSDTHAEESDDAFHLRTSGAGAGALEAEYGTCKGMRTRTASCGQ